MIKKISFLITISITTYVYALPNCPDDLTVRWHNCFGTYTWANGNKYVGEFQDGKGHGQGTYTWANGIQDKGYFLNDEFIPDLCKNMGLIEGTDVYGECILNLIDKI